MTNSKRADFIRAIYDYLKHGYNGYVFDSGTTAIPLSHEEVIRMMTAVDAKDEIDIFVDECHYFGLEATIRLTEEEIIAVLSDQGF